ncbi:hypothetical protein [Caballeronia zhejiangensis]|uniref:hypothetical protein n=1 Tax=Caballeronia zhejiangensis TaxID=871203 RepID=UPI00158F0717|nr:hypothetical protein [Caballeronia zhejiangensis]MCG7403045.1 hypothetical protein [Caballeronia zhejiangensis]MCI1043869.1 hypothetical protein [Caballeronia zhejiangensis]
MARIRTIKPEFWTNPQLARCSVSARLLFIGTWNFADDHGNLPRDPDRLKMQVFPADNIEVEPLIVSLINHGLLIEYSVSAHERLTENALNTHGGLTERSLSTPENKASFADRFLHIPTFAKHQKINRPGRPLYPSPDKAFKDNSVNAHGGLTDGKGKGKSLKPREIKPKTLRSVSSHRSNSRAREDAAETETTNALARKIFSDKGLRLTATTATNLDAALDAGVTVESLGHALDVAIARHAGSPGAYAVTTALDWLHNGTEPATTTRANGHGRDEFDSLAKDRKRVSRGLTGAHREQPDDANVIDVPMPGVSDDARHS